MAFFSKLTETLSDTGKVVAQKAKDVAEITKMNGQIATEENRINAAFVAIGKRFFEEAAGEISDEYINDFSVINESRAKIKELQEQIKDIKGVFNCPGCGAEVSTDSAFCSSCGAKIEQPKPEKEEESCSEEAPEVVVEEGTASEATEEVKEEIKEEVKEEVKEETCQE